MAEKNITTEEGVVVNAPYVGVKGFSFVKTDTGVTVYCGEGLTASCGLTSEHLDERVVVTYAASNNHGNAVAKKLVLRSFQDEFASAMDEVFGHIDAAYDTLERMEKILIEKGLLPEPDEVQEG